MDRPLVEIRDLHKSFGKIEVLKGVNCDVAQSEVVCIIGSSGSGKTTMLRNDLARPMEKNCLPGMVHTLTSNTFYGFWHLFKLHLPDKNKLLVLSYWAGNTRDWN